MPTAPRVRSPSGLKPRSESPRLLPVWTSTSSLWPGSSPGSHSGPLRPAPADPAKGPVPAAAPPPIPALPGKAQFLLAPIPTPHAMPAPDTALAGGEGNHHASSQLNGQNLARTSVTAVPAGGRPMSPSSARALEPELHRLRLPSHRPHGDGPTLHVKIYSSQLLNKIKPGLIRESKHCFLG
nr:uncharacterized protein LOC129058963 [Pongo abelii]